MQKHRTKSKSLKSLVRGPWSFYCGLKLFVPGFVCAAIILVGGCTEPIGRTPPAVNSNRTSPPLVARTAGPADDATNAASREQRTPGPDVAAVPADANPTEGTSKRNLFLESARVDLAHWPSRIIDDSKDAFLKRNNLTALLLAGGAGIAMHNTGADRNLAENFERHRVFHGFVDESFNVIGHPGTHFAATGLWYVLSADRQDNLNRQRAWTMITALTITGGTTVGLKAIRDNDTPNGKRWAWPSGHTASSFAVASVLHEFYGPRVGIPAYAVASGVGYRMMDSWDHWASDVVFGATLGWVVGHTVANKQKKLEIAGCQVVPYFGNADTPAVGFSLVKRF